MNFLNWFERNLVKAGSNTNNDGINKTADCAIENLEIGQLLGNIYVIGYAISIVAVMVSVGIFKYFKVLRCINTRVHTQLFVALSINNTVWIIWYKTVVNNSSVLKINQDWCQALHLVNHFSSSCSYMWMFGESLLLFLTLVMVFKKDSLSIRWFMYLGWGFSFLLVTLYIIVRTYITEDKKRCWTEWSDAMLVFIVPMVITLSIFFVLLIFILSTLVKKLCVHPHQERAVIKKTIHATLTLIPLFGLHIVMIPLEPSIDSTMQKIYIIFSALVTSLQCACISIIFCFTILQVIEEFKGKFAKRERINEAIALSESRRVMHREELVNDRGIANIV